MKRNDNLPSALFCLMIILFTSCTKEELDFDSFDQIKLRPDVTAPLVNAKLEVNDLLETDSVLRENPDGSLRIIFRQDNVAKFSSENLVEIPTQDEVPLPLVAGQPKLALGVSLGTFSGAELGAVDFEEGYLKFGIRNVPSPLQDTVSFQIAITNAVNKQRNDTLSPIFHLLPGQTSMVDSVSLTDFPFDFSNGGTAVNFIGLEAAVIDPGTAPNNTLFEGFFQLTSLVVNSADGFFGQRVVKFPSGSFELDLSALSDFTDGMILTNPKMRLLTASRVGLPVEMKVNFNGANSNNQITSLDMPSFQLSAPAQVGGVVFDTNALNNTNSNIVNFLASVPQQVLYSGNVEINPKGKTASSNFISDASAIDLDMEIEVPLEFRANRMILEEVVDGISFSTENPDLIEELELFIETETSFPFDVSLDLIFLDSITGDSAAGVNIDLLKAAPVDANGRADVNNPVVNTENILLNDAQIDGLLRSDAIRFKAVMNTANQGQTIVKLFTDYHLDVGVALRTKLNANL